VRKLAQRSATAAKEIKGLINDSVRKVENGSALVNDSGKTLGEIVTALLRAGLDIQEVAEHPVDWWGGHRDVRPEERGRIPLSFSIVATRGR